MKTIIFVFFEKYCYQNDYEELNLKKMQEKGYCVEVWSLVHYVYPFIEKTNAVYEGQEVVYINNFRDAKKNIKRVKNNETVYIMYQGGFRKPIANKLRRLVSREGAHYCDMYIGHSFQKCFWDIALSKRSKVVLSENKVIAENSVSQDKLCVLKRKLKKMFHVGLKESLKIICDKISIKKEELFDEYICRKYPPCYNIWTTEAETEFKSSGIKKYVSKEKDIFIHNQDYDKFLICQKNSAENIEVLEEKKYIVFVDQGGVTHPDVKMNIYGERYISELNHLFSMVERQYGLPVIIALHPKANYKGDEFGNRKMIRGKTDILIKNCQLALIHYSTAMSWIVLWKKPFIIITNNNLQNYQYCHEILELWSLYFNKPLLNISELGCDEKIKEYCVTYDNRYDEYKELIIKNEGTTQRLYSDVIIEMIEKIFADTET